jgi:hypothetical protein
MCKIESNVFKRVNIRVSIKPFNLKKLCCMQPSLKTGCRATQLYGAAEVLEAMVVFHDLNQDLSNLKRLARD